MRIKWSRHLAVAALFLTPLFGMTGCSSSAEEGDVEAVEENVSEDGSANAAIPEDGEVPAENTALNNGQTEGGMGGNEVAVAENPAAGINAGTDAVSPEVNTTEGELQSVISDMNGPNPAANAATNAVPAEAPAAVADAGAPAAPAMAAPAPSTGTSVVTLPEAGAKMAYVVQQGDTLSKIAVRIYGDKNRWRELADLTGVPNPSRIYPGDVIYYALDDSSKAFAQTYESLRRGVTTVQSGETLATISKRIFGKHRNWKSIWRQNDLIDDPDNLTPGTVIYYVTQDQLSAALKKIESVKITVNKTQKASGGFAKKVDGSNARMMASVWKSPVTPFSMNV
jgi:nucleoid-associated protein YgaU